MKKQHFFVIRDHHWGASRALFTAMGNANVRYAHPFTECVDLLSYIRDENDIKGTIEELDYIKQDPKGVREEGTQEFAVYITDAELWEFSQADEVDGSPTYKWLGDGDKPDGLVPTVTLHLVLDLSTGIISVQPPRGKK